MRQRAEGRCYGGSRGGLRGNYLGRSREWQGEVLDRGHEFSPLPIILFLHVGTHSCSLLSLCGSPVEPRLFVLRNLFGVKP